MNTPVASNGGNNNEATMLLRAILDEQYEQKALLRVLAKKQHDDTRNTAQWKKEHPELSKRCAEAAKGASEMMTKMVERLVDDLEELEADGWDGGEFKLHELIDKYGYKFQQFSALLQTIAQLGN